VFTAEQNPIALALLGMPASLSVSL